MFRPVGTFSLFVVGLSLLATGCSDHPAVPTGELPTLSLSGTSTQLPPSRNDGVALISERRAGTIDSYLTQVVCAEPGSARFEGFGREGEGPGEFRRVSSLIRGAEGAVIVRDARQRRLSTVLQDGSIRHLFVVPPTWKELRADLSPIIGYTSQPFAARDSFAVAVLNLDRNGDVVGDTIFLGIGSAAALPPGAPVPALVRSQTGEFVAWGGSYVLHRFDHMGRPIETFTAPQYRPELPNARDREVNAETYRSMFGTDLPSAQTDAFAARPKVPLLPGDPLRFDPQGRLWVATTVDRDSLSHLDIFDGSRYLGSVAVRDRMLAFDILGSTLVILAERRVLSGDGLPIRELDWYRIID